MLSHEGFDQFPTRSSCMYLKTVDGPRSFRHLRPRGAEETFSLNTQDISGAQHGTTSICKFLKMHNDTHDDFTLRVSDIYGACPTKQIPVEVKKPNNRVVSNEDIELSKPRPKTFTTTRIVNPLEPDYDLPNVAERPVTPPKFLRDTLNISDIDGTKNCPKKKTTVIHDPLRVSDIEGTSPGWKPSYKRRTSVSKCLEISDINHDGEFKSTRVTNPLEPRYVYDVPPPELLDSISSDTYVPSWTIGDVPKSHPPPPRGCTGSNYCLRTDDIYVRQGDSHKLPPTFPKNRREYRSINLIDDIPGAHSSHRHSQFFHETGRVTNPLDPSYTFLDGPPQTDLNQIPRTSISTPCEQYSERLSRNSSSSRSLKLGPSPQPSSSSRSQRPLSISLSRTSEKDRLIDTTASISSHRSQASSGRSFRSSSHSQHPSSHPFDAASVSSAPSSVKLRHALARTQLDEDIASVRSLQ